IISLSLLSKTQSSTNPSPFQFHQVLTHLALVFPQLTESGGLSSDSGAFPLSSHCIIVSLFLRPHDIQSILNETSLREKQMWKPSWQMTCRTVKTIQFHTSINTSLPKPVAAISSVISDNGNTERCFSEQQDHGSCWILPSMVSV